MAGLPSAKTREKSARQASGTGCRRSQCGVTTPDQTRNDDLIEIEFFAIHPVQLASHFRTVCGADLLHDVMDMRLHCTLAHAELEGDDLVRLADPDRMDNLDLARGEQFSQNVVVDIGRRGLKNHGSGHIHAAGGGKMNGLDTDFYIDRGGN